MRKVKPMDPDMKLYVWTDVLCDYSCGMVCVLAHDLEEAHRLYRKKQDYGDELGLPTRTITQPEAFIVWGGG